MMMTKKTIWPYGLTVVILLYIGWLLFFLFFSNSQKADVVEENYYRKGIEYQRQIDKRIRTNHLPGQVNIIYTPQNKLIIRLPIKADSGIISLYRPSDASLDKKYDLHLDDGRRQVLDVAHLKKGKWTVKIDWQTSGQNYYFEKTLIAK